MQHLDLIQHVCFHKDQHEVYLYIGHYMFTTTVINNDLYNYNMYL